jgi:ADP-ribosylglycohydrolase
MGRLKPGATYIYESPDGGLTTYAREMGAPPESRVMIGQSWQAKEQVEKRMWTEIYDKRNQNTALQSAVEQCIIIYKLSEDYTDGI